MTNLCTMCDKRPTTQTVQCQTIPGSLDTKFFDFQMCDICANGYREAVASAWDDARARSLLASELDPDPLEEMAAGLCPECLNPLGGGDMSCISSECRFYGRVELDAVERPGKRMVYAHHLDGQFSIDGEWAARQ
jgi:hypothetical protein